MGLRCYGDSCPKCSVSAATVVSYFPAVPEDLVLSLLLDRNCTFLPGTSSACISMSFYFLGIYPFGVRLLRSILITTSALPLAVTEMAGTHNAKRAYFSNLPV